MTKIFIYQNFIWLCYWGLHWWQAIFNSLRPSLAIRHQGTGSILLLIKWLVTCSVPSHYLNQYWLTVTSMKFVSKYDSRECTWKHCKLTAILFRLNVLNHFTYHMHDYNSYKTQNFCGHNILIAVNQYGSENINHKTKLDFMKSLIMFYARRSHINIVFFNWIYRFWVYYITWQCAFNDRAAVDDLGPDSI